jgi:cyanophycin synthetase
MNAEAVRLAFQKASVQAGPLATPMILERQNPGSYARATLVGGRLGALFVSRAPEVTGDGVQTIGALARIHNGLDEHCDLSQRGLGVLDAVLASQGLSAEDQVQAGRVVAVGYPNQGPATDETQRIHPGLRRMLVRLGRLFPLPVLGVDLLVHDVTERFDPSRDIILEVNANPGFSLHDYVDQGPARDLSGLLLSHLFPRGAKDARVPIVVGGPGSGRSLEALARELSAAGLCPAGFTRGRLWSGKPTQIMGDGVLSARLLSLDAYAQVLLLEVDEPLAVHQGLPVDRADWILGPRPGASRIAGLMGHLFRGGSCRQVSSQALVESLTAQTGEEPGKRPLIGRS